MTHGDLAEIIDVKALVAFTSFFYPYMPRLHLPQLHQHLLFGGIGPQAFNRTAGSGQLPTLHMNLWRNVVGVLVQRCVTFLRYAI